ncbi:hypothetical protein [Actinacidiphila oryziradicis]|uniref:hypothetical protein n=1 Tax=Actinacidiphila oryziradicis TaxID=2571141 RepID=UPI003898F496
MTTRSKGLVERANGYLETSFVPGRTFTGPDDFNSQLQDWLKVANRRLHRRILARPADRWEADRAAMLALPPVGPSQWYRFHTRPGLTLWLYDPQREVCAPRSRGAHRRAR